ncbi:PorP/SprF family type IX secretion system membrane protein [Eudoraea chungangensis]|uniref:PorP/SprF family type IX secretion system membrane protein n=1 Tax=Eudoraea chungangensis TaxID=1481905 RepID=UPI0023EBFCEE|nr:PorP/SprF family type IX secretion system membrane protein [Eudoraea chungangensis]
MIQKNYFLRRASIFVLFSIALGISTIFAQEGIPELSSSTSYHNQLFFNRFLINPTFSLVREDKSYLNILHRNEYATFDDNRQNYFIGFSNKLNNNTALGLSLYSQWSGVIQEFGINANYATSVQLGEKSKLTFGTNVTYLTEGIDSNRAISTVDDPELLGSRKENKLAIQPGVTLSMGQFDFGLYAEDLLKYNQTTDEFSTNLNAQSVKASLQYTHAFMARTGLFAFARLMPMVQIGQNLDNSIAYLGTVLLDLPKYGWLQAAVDDEFGMSMGLGFNLSNKLSLGYLMEKNFMQDTGNLGWNHELLLAYTFKNTGPIGEKGIVMDTDQNRIDEIVRNYEEQIAALKAEYESANNKDPYLREDIAMLEQESKEFVKSEKSTSNTEIKSDNLVDNSKKSKKKSKKSGLLKEDINLAMADAEAMGYENTSEINSMVYENRLILDQLILRQDSIEKARNQDMERRFETIVRLLRSDVEKKKTESPSDFIAPQKQEMVAEAAPQRVKKTELKEIVAETKPVRSIRPEYNDPKDFVTPPIKILNQADIVGAKTGYYVIANVYSNKKYLEIFVESLKTQGLNPKKFYNRENGLHYVYLADYEVKQEAEMAYVSHLDGKYAEEKWIMSVENPTTTAQIMFEDE